MHVRIFITGLDIVLILRQVSQKRHYLGLINKYDYNNEE